MGSAFKIVAFYLMESLFVFELFSVRDGLIAGLCSRGWSIPPDRFLRSASKKSLIPHTFGSRGDLLAGKIDPEADVRRCSLFRLLRPSQGKIHGLLHKISRQASHSPKFVSPSKAPQARRY